MALPREPNLHPSSPESSKGGGGSYKHEGTPDTRLTAFSPEEASVRSSKVTKLPNLKSSDSQVTIFPTNAGNGITFSNITGLQLEKDPFVSSSATALKPDQRLCPTASAFRPFSNPLAPRGVVIAPNAQESSFGGGIEPDASHLTIPVSSVLSTDLQLSRCIEISSPTQIVTVDNVEAFLAVRTYSYID